MGKSLQNLRTQGILELPGSEVHVWRARLDIPPDCLTCLGSDLSADESARAERFRRQPHRDRFVASRGILRLLLGGYLAVEPAGICFRHGPRGKPSLAGGEGQDKIKFNLSHSGDRALYAFAAGMDVGIDLEKIRPGLDHEGIARRFFSPRESATLESLPVREREGAFFDCWARKEACLKGIGEGLRLPLDRFDDLPEISRWTVMDLEAGGGYAAALAVKGEGWKLRIREVGRDLCRGRGCEKSLSAGAPAGRALHGN